MGIVLKDVSMQFDVATSGIYTGETKTAPSGLGLYGSGGLYSQPFVDRYRKIRTPTPYELVAQFRNAVYVCCNLNANAVAQCPRRLYVQTRKGEAKPKVRTRGLGRKQEEYIRRKAASSTVGRVSGDSNVEEVMDHPLLDLLAKPNPFFDGQSLNKLTVNYLDIVGQGIWYIGEKNRLGTPKEIWPLPAQQVWPWRENPDDNKIVDTWLFTSGRQQYRFPYKDILQFHYFNPYEPYSVPYSPIHAVFEHVTVTEQSLSHQQAMFDNDARFDALVTPNDVIGEAEGNRLERKLNNKFRGAGYGSLLVAESAFKVQPMQWSPIDLGLLELYGVTRDMIFDAYGVPQAMATKETNLANLEASLTQHARQGVVPRLNTVDEAINRRLVPLYDESGRLFVASDNPVKEDDEADVKKMQGWLDRGVVTRKEARVYGGFEDEKWAETPLMPTNMQAVGEDGKPDLPPEPIGGPNGNNGGKPGGGGTSGSNGGSGRGNGKKPKKPSDSGGKPKKSLVQDVARLSKAVAGGSLSPETAAWALAQDHGVSKHDAEHHLSQIPDDTAQIKAALSFAHVPEMDDQTEKRVTDLWQQKSHDNIDWIAPDLDSKKNQAEIARACASLKLEQGTLTELLKTGELVDLKEKAWKRIQNSDSLKVSRLRDVIEIAGRDKKKVKNLLGEFLEGRIKAPIVLAMQGESWLINGNTRLCLAQVFKTRPKVWLARLPKPEKVAPEIDWRAKGLEAAFAKLAALDAQDGLLPVPFLVCDGLPADAPRGAFASETVQLRDLRSVVPMIEIADVRAAIERLPDMSVIQANDGTRYIKRGLSGFVAAWLRGEDEVLAAVELAKAESAVIAPEPPVEIPEPLAKVPESVAEVDPVAPEIPLESEPPVTAEEAPEEPKE